jgi:cytochrome b561
MTGHGLAAHAARPRPGIRNEAPPRSIATTTETSMTPTTPAAYTRVAIVLHWLIALCIFINFGLGLYMETFPKHTPQNDSVLFFHASLGSLICMLAVLRLAWRLTHRPPELPASVVSWQVAASHALHWTLYVLMLVVPLTGYVHRLAGAHPVSFFGLFDLPVLVGRDEPLRLLTDTLHDSLVWVVAILVAGHLGAVVKHRFIDRDGVAGRMLRWS